MIYIKIHSTENGTILAMCDSSVFGKILTEGDIEINLKDYSDFYNGELVSRDKAKEQIKKEQKHINSANIVGEESVKIAIEEGVIERGNVKIVMKIPYANAFKMI